MRFSASSIKRDSQENRCVRNRMDISIANACAENIFSFSIKITVRNILGIRENNSKRALIKKSRSEENNLSPLYALPLRPNKKDYYIKPASSSTSMKINPRARGCRAAYNIANESSMNLKAPTYLLPASPMNVKALPRGNESR